MNEDHQRWSDQLAPYLLGALPPEEGAEVERHMDGCEHCRAEARWLSVAVEVLPESVQRADPPPELRARLMAEVREDSRRAAVPARRARGGLGARWSLPSWSLRPALGLLLAILVVAGAAGYLVGKSGSGSAGADRFTTSAGGVVAVVSRDGEDGSLSLRGVEQLPDGRVLEAWVEREGQVEPVRALFVPDQAGRASTALPDMEGVEAVMVTVEPKGGSAQPSSEPIVALEMAQ